MKQRFINITFLILAAFCFAGCSNLFESFINEDMSLKKGDDSLYYNSESEGENENISSGLVVIKNTAKTKNQIIYKAGQEVYFVGNVPEGYSDYKVNYSNGTKVSLCAKDDPVELRCFPNDVNAVVEWQLSQTWEYKPEYKDNKSNYIKSQTASKLETVRSVYFKTEAKDKASIIYADIPYGVTVATCKVVADDNQYQTEYKIILTKEYSLTAESTVSAEEDANNVTNHGLVVIKASAPDRNAINFSSTTFEYKVNNLHSVDNNVKFRCNLADTNTKLEWTAVQTKRFEAVKSTFEKTVTDFLLGTSEKVKYEYCSGQTETDCNIPVSFVPAEGIGINEITAAIPYGITEVTAAITFADNKTAVYKIILRRDYCAEPVSETDFEKKLEEGIVEGDYSELKEIKLTVTDEKDESSSIIELETKTTPEATSYTIKVDEEADSISIEAIAASDNSVISNPKAVTKYGEVPALDNMKLNLIGGKTRISFTVTDETGISRTYMIYVDKPEDGDTTLKTLEYTPAAGFENGVEGFVLDTSYKGSDKEAESKYKMTLSADSRKNISEVVFKAVSTKKRTLVSYGVSDSVNGLPSEWSTEYTQATVQNHKVIIPESYSEYINKFLWIKTVSDAYYHLKADKKSYESEKRTDTTYHKVLITKAGNMNKELTALAAVVTYEDGTTEKILDLKSISKVAYKTEDKLVNVSTYADQIDFYFRPLNKNAAINYSAINTIYDETENTSFTGYSTGSALTKISGACEFLNDNSDEYYKLTIGSIENGLTSVKDLSRGTTAATIGGRTYNFVKPDLKNVSYSLGLGKGIDKKWEYYIYLKNSEDSLQMNLTAKQQNQIFSVVRAKHTNTIDGTEITNGANIPFVIKHASDNGGKLTDWTISLTEIPVGTTTLELNIKNEKQSANCTYYIIRADNTDTRLKNISFAELTPSEFAADWNTGMNKETYTYVHSKTLNVNAGKQTLVVEPVNTEAYIVIERRHSSQKGITSATASEANWSLASDKTVQGIASQNNGALEYVENFTEENANENAGTILYTIKVSPNQGEEATHIYYFILHVQSDTTAQLKALKIIQEGENTNGDRTILSNTFNPEIYEYKKLYASLNYTGNIIITPVKSGMSKIVRTSIKLNGKEIANSESYINTDGVITIPYAEYINQLGKTYTVSYEVKAQDENIPSVIYTADIIIPEYTVVTESQIKKSFEERSFTIPEGITAGLGYRFGSVISDDSIAVKNYFGGIDIIGTSDGNTWYESSFGGSGFQFVLNIDGIDYWVKLNNEGKLEKLYKYNGSSSPEIAAVPAGIDFTVNPKFVSDNDKNYIELSFSVKNANGCRVKLGAAIDTLIGTLAESTSAANDSVTVKETNNGFMMEGKKFTFQMILKNAYKVDDVDSLWYGSYQGGNYLTQVFEAKTSRLNSGEDSAASFYWNLGTENSVTKTIRISMEELTK